VDEGTPRVTDQMLKVLTVVGTRPEIIRLAPTIHRLEHEVEHVLVHTGQNHDVDLSDVFFRDLGLNAPRHFLSADTSSLASVLGSVLVGMERVLLEERPDAVLLLGDTNSSIAAVIARRMQIPVFHMEAGNRSFDPNVPEEINRRLVDHVSDYNLVYSEHARRNLLAEGIHPSRILLTGSPMREVIEANRAGFEASDVLERERLSAGGYFVASLHRQENVDDPSRLRSLLVAFHRLQESERRQVLISTHPRTRARLHDQDPELTESLHFHRPFGFHDYIALQMNARAVLSDSGTISEESAILGFPAVSLRDAIERPEAIDTGVAMLVGVEPASVVNGVAAVVDQYGHDGPPDAPVEYLVSDVSRRVVNFIRSNASTHHARVGIRRLA
jgi:UDP-N-acetyl-L-fucosamine synthase